MNLIKLLSLIVLLLVFLWLIFIVLRKFILKKTGNHAAVNPSFLALAVFFLAAGIYSFIEPYLLQVRTYTISSPEIPASFNNTKIVFLADIHHGPFFDISRVRSMVDRVNSMDPDMILMGGDYVHWDKKYITPCFYELGKLKAPLGIYGVLGNHDHWEDAGLTLRMMDKNGIVSVNNKAVWITKGKDRIRVGGVGDLDEDTQDIDAVIAGVTKEDFVILLSHNPDYAERDRSGKIDLMLSGHTHGGQVTFFGLFAPFVPSAFWQKYRTGEISLGKMKVIVSNGIGTVTPPMRFFAPPQIVLVRLVKENK